ncbi:MAG: GxxExxY protein [Blastocatellia bacterium]
MDQESTLILRNEVYTIIGAAIEVHSVLGPGFLEAVYHSAIRIELTDRGIPFEPEKLLPVHYKGKRLTTDYRADLVCYGEIIAELKALDKLTGKEEAQLLNYLKATGMRVGLLINFGCRGKLEWKRFIN